MTNCDPAIFNSASPKIREGSMPFEIQPDTKSKPGPQRSMGDSGEWMKKDLLDALRMHVQGFGPQATAELLCSFTPARTVEHIKPSLYGEIIAAAVKRCTRRPHK
jgi:hypothetical protein